VAVEIMVGTMVAGTPVVVARLTAWAEPEQAARKKVSGRKSRLRKGKFI
jgi:hypothetical protein